MSIYAQFPGLDLAWRGPLTLTELAKRYDCRPSDITRVAKAIGETLPRACDGDPTHAYYRARMDRALVADLHLQSRLRSLTRAEAEMLAEAQKREDRRKQFRVAKERQLADPESRAANARRSAQWQKDNRERANRRRQQLYPSYAPKRNARRRRLYAEQREQHA